MDLSLETLRLLPWDSAQAEEWNAAYEKVENYLRACRVSSHLYRARLTAVILMHVYDERQKGLLPPDQPLAEAAILETREQILEWLEPYLLPREGLSSVSFGEAMLALYLADGATAFPYSFLDSKNMPAELQNRLRSRAVQAGPGLAVSSMVARKPDLGGVSGIVGSAVDRIATSPMLKTLIFWAFLLFFLGVFLFWYTRRL